MIKFRQKDFTLQEGHYTGPKDLQEIPGTAELIGKGALTGAVTNAVVGKLLNRYGYSDDSSPSVISDAFKGAGYGIVGGIFAKMFLNHLHKPMTSIKYRDVDRNIRQQFGIFRMQGVTVGDTLDRRSKLEDRFSFNDRNVSNYKINFAIYNNKVTMYTLGLTNNELEKVNKSLDYYCKKYFAMEYSSRVINAKANSYSADIIFTHTAALSNFIIELGKILDTKINLLDNDAIIEPRIRDSIEEIEEDRDFSDSGLYIDRPDLIKILAGGVVRYMRNVRDFFRDITSSAASTLLGIIAEGTERLNKNELQRAGVLGRRGDINNSYLLDNLKALRYIEGFHYTKGEEKSDFNISIISGLFVITVPKDGKVKLGELEKYFNRSEFGNVYLYSYVLRNDQEFRMLLGKVMKLGKPNVWIDKIKVPFLKR
jgi:hypothetical protein